MEADINDITVRRNKTNSIPGFSQYIEGMDSSPSSDSVMISSSRLKELEELESKLPKLIEKALKDHKTTVLNRLHERDKENPQAVNLRVKRYANKHRETINRKRRERRKEKQQEQIGVVNTYTPVIKNTNIITYVSNSKKQPEGGTTLNFSN